MNPNILDLKPVAVFDSLHGACKATVIQDLLDRTNVNWPRPNRLSTYSIFKVDNTFSPDQKNMYDFISIANKLYPEIKDEYYNNQKRLIDKANAEFTARKERNCLGRGSFYRDYSDIGFEPYLI